MDRPAIPKRIFILAGEPSGDLHGSRLVASLLNLYPGTEVLGWGGDLMQQAGAEITKHYRDLAFMGFAEVVKHLPQIFRNFRICRSEISAFRPDVVVLIDYPGFNLRMARWLREKGYKVVYYISPQVWAWKSSRVRQIQAYVDLLLVILPFETAFFGQYGLQAHFVGHPLLEAVTGDKTPKEDDWKTRCGIPADRPLIALLPGSRQQEIRKILPVQLRLAERLPEFDFVVAGAPAQSRAFYDEIIDQALGSHPGARSRVHWIQGHTYDLLRSASGAVVTSGTATLETGLFAVPQVVVYKGSTVSYRIARMLVKIPYISLVNLILDEPFVEELIQHDLRPDLLEKALRKAIAPERQPYIQEQYRKLRGMLSHPDGTASDNAARLIGPYLA